MYGSEQYSRVLLDASKSVLQLWIEVLPVYELDGSLSGGEGGGGSGGSADTVDIIPTVRAVKINTE